MERPVQKRLSRRPTAGWRETSFRSTLTERENPEGLEQALRLYAYLLLMSYLRRQGGKNV